MVREGLNYIYIIDCKQKKVENGAVQKMEFKVFLLQSLTSSDGFLHTIGGEVNVIPASESVLQIPYGLTVSEEHNSVGSFGCFLHDLN